jgi:hypothetical protein
MGLRREVPERTLKASLPGVGLAGHLNPRSIGDHPPRPHLICAERDNPNGVYERLCVNSGAIVAYSRK